MWFPRALPTAPPPAPPSHPFPAAWFGARYLLSRARPAPLSVEAQERRPGSASSSRPQGDGNPRIARSASVQRPTGRRAPHDFGQTRTNSARHRGCCPGRYGGAPGPRPGPVVPAPPRARRGRPLARRPADLASPCCTAPRAPAPAPPIHRGCAAARRFPDGQLYRVARRPPHARAVTVTCRRPSLHVRAISSSWCGHDGQGGSRQGAVPPIAGVAGTVPARPGPRGPRPRPSLLHPAAPDRRRGARPGPHDSCVRRGRARHRAPWGQRRPRGRVRGA